MRAKHTYTKNRANSRLQTVFKATLFVLLFALVFSIVFVGANDLELSKIQSGEQLSSVADAATATSVSALNTTYTLGFTNFTQVTDQSSHVNALATYDSGNGFQMTCKDGHGLFGGCDANVVAYARLNLGSALKNSDVAMNFSVTNAKNDGNKDQWGIAITTSVPNVTGVADSTFNPSYAIGKSGWNEGAYAVKNCDAVMASSYSTIYVAVYGNADYKLELYFNKITVTFYKPEKSLSSLTTSVSSWNEKNFVFKHTAVDNKGGPNGKFVIADKGETIGIYSGTPGSEEDAQDATGVLYTPIKLTGSLLNHVKNGANVNVKFSVTNAHNGGNSDYWGIAITSGVPSLTNVSDGTFNPTSLAKSAWNESAGDTKEVTAKIPYTTTTVIYVAIYSNSDVGWAIGFKNIKVTIDSFSYEYTINFTAGANGKVSTSSAKIVGNSSSSPTESPAKCTATANTGYHFLNWTRGTTTTQQADTADISINSTQFFAYGNSYKANFTTNTGTIIYNVNGGTGSIANQEIKYADSKVYLSNGAGFSRADYILAGWSEHSDSFDAEYTLGHEVSTRTAQSSNTEYFSLASEREDPFTLYAIWKQSDFGVLSGKDRDGTWGSANNPFVISTQQHLFNLSNIVNGAKPFDSVTGKSSQTVTTAASDLKYTNCYFAVSANLSMNTTDWKDKFKPIGINASNCFAGTFYGGSGVYADGNKANKTITLNMTGAAGYVGLFGYTSNAKIEYITVAGRVVGNGENVGGIVGFAYGTTTIDHCVNTATVSGPSGSTGNYVGGIAGRVSCLESVAAKITNCTSSGNVTGYTGVGGIVGYGSMVNLTLENNSASGTVEGTRALSGSEGAIGGIIGRSSCNLTVKGCSFNGTVTGAANGVGGILGYIASGYADFNMMIEGCSVSGTINGGINVGGIGGRLQLNDASKQFYIKNCYNDAAVNQTHTGSTGTGGGIVGYFFVNCANKTAQIYNCVNKGDVDCANKSAGGIVGNADATTDKGAAIKIEYCYNFGATTATTANTAGGIAAVIGNGVTVKDSWDFGTLGTNVSASATIIGNHLYILSTIDRQVYPAENVNDLTSTDWKMVKDGKVVTAFRTVINSYTANNGRYFSIYNTKDTKTAVTPSRMTSDYLDDTKDADVSVSNVVFASNIKDKSGAVANKLCLDWFGISPTTSSIEKTYSDASAVKSDWIEVSSSKHQYATSAKVWFKVDGTWTETVPTSAKIAGYDVRLSLYNGDFLVGTKSATYIIKPKSIAIDQSDIAFGYGNGVVSGAYEFAIGGNSLFALDKSDASTFFTANDSPFALVYKDNNNSYININNYNLYHKLNYVLSNATDYDIELTQSQGIDSINGNNFVFNGTPVVSVVLTLKGKGNYTDTRTIRFTLLDSDFGGDYLHANWGSFDNPYLIQNDAHLVRLAQIVAGAPAWNSLKNLNANAEATSCTYQGTYFFLTANVNANSSGGFVSIGKSGNHPFSATFNGNDKNNNKFTVKLSVDESAENINYTGLFGYLQGASIANITTSGTVKGVDYVGGIVGYATMNTTISGAITNGATVTGRNFVGGIGGEVACDLNGAVNGSGATVSGTRAVGGIVGYLAGSVVASTNKANVRYITNSSDYTDGMFICDGVSFKGIGGIVGFINTDGAIIENCINDSSATISAAGAIGVGGIVGFANVNSGYSAVNATEDGRTENRAAVSGLSYVGGIVGYARNVKISENCAISADVTSTGSYAGGIAGKWVVTDKEQIDGQLKVAYNITVDGVSYVGGLVGWLDAHDASGLKLHPYITRGKENPVKVKGSSYVGALYGGFEGYGYKRTTASASDSDTLIYIDPSTAEVSNNPYIYVQVTLKSDGRVAGRVAGGLFGYVSGAGIMFLGDWYGTEHTPVTFAGGNSHRTDFFGGIAGVLGENATLESAKREQGNIVICLVPHSVTYRDTSYSTTLVNNGDFVGSIAGFVASTAGVYISSDTTLMGNFIQLYNDNEITARSYVGGIFGAIGKKADYTVSGDQKLQNLVRYGSFGDQATGPNNTLRYAPADDGGHGKLFNYRAITGTGDYVGGIIGYVGDGALIAFVNASVNGNTEGFTLNNARTFLSVYNGYGVNPTTGDTATIRGANYVGGIAGYVSAMSHELLHAVSLMRVMASSNGSTENGSYAGGIFGFMGGGSIVDSIATSGYSSTSTSVNAFMGSEYVGGIVGMLNGGRISGSVSRGFKFTSVSLTRGGIVGSVNAGASVESSWTFYLATSPTYATTSANNNGNYVIVDSSVVANRSPSFSEYARMVGLFALTGVTSVDSKTISVHASSETINQTKAGFLSISTTLPAENNQLVFYDASGSDVASPNVFETIAYQNRTVYYRFDMTSTASFSICVRAIEFSDIKQYTGTSEQVKKDYVAEAYVRPSANDIYDINITGTPVFSGGYIQSARGEATYPGRNPSGTVILGTFNKTFDIGDEATPYVITIQQEWDDFATAVRTNSGSINGYYGKYVKLATDSITVTTSNLAGVTTAASSAASNIFKGTFDGDGHTITISVSSGTASSLTGMSVFPGAAGATFKNLTIKGDITATGNAFNSTAAENIAGFVGKPLGTLTFENCTNLANIKANRTAGGLVGFANGQTINFISCVNGRNNQDLGTIECDDADIDGYAEYDYGTGGIIGLADNDITIESCKNEGYIRGGYNVGGIIGKALKGTNVYNCANNGKIFADAHWVDESDYANHKDTAAYRKVYAGGLVGQVTGKETEDSVEGGWLNMYASYNSGRIVGYGPIVGGLVGSVGSLILKNNFGRADMGYAKAASMIAYCYNSGDVYSSGESTSYNHRSTGSTWGLLNPWEREELNGSIVGGIVGFIAWGEVNYCYNIGKISTFRIVGNPGSWQARIGGIAGQVQPTGSGYYTKFNSCYNLGELFVFAKTSNIAGVSSTRIYWGGGICGYSDGNDDFDLLKSSMSGWVKNCYTIANYLHIYCSADDQSWGSESILEPNNDDKGRYVIGTVVNSVDQLTTYMASDGKLKVDQPISGSSEVESNNQAATLITSSGTPVATFTGKTNSYTNSAFTNGTAYGYLYVYGCLPQLAVFALDTKEGLSMLSVSYGRNEYDKFVGNQAGSKESPYVIKDGVGLLALSALNGAKSGSSYYNFKNKYIEFADGANNIEGMKSSYINMNMTAATSSLKSGSSDTFNQSGKNYFIYSMGAASGQTTVSYGSNPTAIGTLRTNWYNKNYYFNGASTVRGSDFNTYANFYSVGRYYHYTANSTTATLVPFAGNISGLQGANGNTEIRNLKVSERNATNAYAGLFGAVYDATISNITVSAGNIYAYSTSNNSTYKTFAGGIAGYAGGNSKISNCQAGSSGINNMLTVVAFADNNTEKSPSVEGYAGGIVGAAGPSQAGSSSAELKTIDITDCRSANAKIMSAQRYIGGIMGYAGNPWTNSASSGRGNYINISNAYVYNSIIRAYNNDDKLTITSANAGTETGGIVGTNDGNTILTISNSTVGAKHPADTASTLTVSIYGEHSFGGVIGTANGNTALGNITVTNSTTINRVAYDSAVNYATGLYRTAVGGVIGKTMAVSGNNTLRDSITFNGNININAANASPSDSNPTANIGGIIGAMGDGTRFLSGSVVKSTGKIKIDSALGTNAFVRNIGGIAGATIDGVFDGVFEVSPQITAPNATNIGGFIGRNFGVANILAGTNQTTVTINANITGKSQIGGLVGLNGYQSNGLLQIGADTYLGGRYEGLVTITIAATANITANGDDAGGLFGRNSADGVGQGVVITKGVLHASGTVKGYNNVGGIVGNNEGNISMGGSSVPGASLEIQNAGTVVGGIYSNGNYVSNGNNVGGVIGYLQRGTIAGKFGNTGSVSGYMFVGGSIGRVDKDAVLTAINDNTYFYNGSYGTNVDSQNALVADSSVGNVSGTMYVGGSIGGVFGKIEGTGNHTVRFINEGEVNAKNFMGGNIGLLAGTLHNAQFTNSGQVNSENGTNAIGGSVGFVGVTKEYDTVTYQHQPISVKNVHFEFIGENNIVVKGAVDDSKDELKQGGVGGAIGVIGNADNGFDNDSNSSLWEKVTLYTASGVDAKNVCNVGGAIGLIKANNIVISNMLAFYTTVTGKKNVGGIVGAVSGHNIQVLDSFNIEGTVAGTTSVGSNVGGIIGLAMTGGEGATVADTSYWVKGYANDELMALDLDTVVQTLGRYVAVRDNKNVVFTLELTNAYGSPANYTNNEEDGTGTDEATWKEYLKRFTGGRDVKPVNGVWAWEQDANGYTTGEASTGWYYVYANDRAGLDTTHISAADTSLPSKLDVSEREQELKYWKRIAKAYTAEDMVADPETGIIAATETLTSPIVGEIDKHGSENQSSWTVSGNGAPESGHIYAAALESQVSGYYLYMDASGIKPDIYYGEETEWNNMQLMRNPFYLDAKTSLDRSDPNDKNAQNVAIYYRSVGVGGTLTYNGYQRYVPITDEVGKADSESTKQLIKYLSAEDVFDGKSGDYVYTMTDVTKDGNPIDDKYVVEAGTYKTNVNIYFYDSIGKHGKIGGFEQSELRIETLGLANKLTPENGTYNGDDTTGSVVLTLHGIAPLDNGVNSYTDENNKTMVRSVKFNISGEKTDYLTGTLDIGALMALTGGVGKMEFGTGYNAREESKKYMKFSSDKIYLFGYTVSLTTDTNLKDTHWDTTCIVDDRYSKGVRPYSITLTFRFTETINDTFVVELDKKDMSKNYNAEKLSQEFEIAPKKLTLKLANNATNTHKFDGTTHSTQYVFEGWVANVQNENRTALIQSLKPYIVGAGYGDAATTSWNDITSSFTLRQNNRIYATVEWLGTANPPSIAIRNMRYVGEYDVLFATTLTYETGGKSYILTEGGNYYVELPAEAMFQVMENSLRMTWSTDNSDTYDAQYRWLVAEFTAQEAPFGSADLLAEEIATMFPDGYDMNTVKITSGTETTVSVGFRVGPNAGTHSVSLPNGTNSHTESCAIENPMTGSYTINKLNLTIGLSGNDTVKYNGGHHRASGISATCANPDADPKWSFDTANGAYTLDMFTGVNIKNEKNDNKLRVTVTYNGGVAAVNAGTYNATITNNNVTFMSANRNFNISASGSGSLTVSPVRLTLFWTDDSTKFMYDRAWHGRGLASSMTNYGSNFTPGSVIYTPTSSNSTAKITVCNTATNKSEELTIPVGGTHAAVNASDTPYVATVNLSSISVSGTNAAGSAQIGNYDIVFTNANNGSYVINRRQVTVSGISGNSTSKTYDATTAVVGAVGTPEYQGTVKPTNVTATAVYDNPNVGTNKTITYTLVLSGDDANNFIFDNGSTTTTYEYTAPRVQILRRQLIIRLDRLRNGYATKTYDGTAWFGGMAGAKSIVESATAVSAVHRSGEGFTVYGIAEGETVDGAVIITATYVEASNGRSMFDSYVNNVVGSGADISIGAAKYGEEGYFYKNLVFAASGASAGNYSFIVCMTGDDNNIGDVVGNSDKTVTVSGEGSDVKIAITPYTVRAKYKHDWQSYATEDNTYNTNWIPVSGSAAGVKNQTLEIAVVNNWMYQNNNPATAIPATYKSYTVIRGAENSKVLSARLANTDDGAQVNYRLSNQPVLTIGYFLNSDEFRIGSMASLMIATYYYAVSQGMYDEFGVVISQAKWNFVVSAQDYENGTGDIPSVNDAEGNAIEFNSWDEYFAWLASDAGGNRDVFLNESEADNGWGYYSVDEDGNMQQSYQKFRQVANISGVLTQQDIAILNGMFNKVTIDSEGNVIAEQSYTWGVGGDYLTNFLKLSEGNVATAIGSIFAGEFVGQYNGGGYVIDGVNIIGVASESVNRFGMFEKVTIGQVQNVHLRNFNVNINASGETYIGAIAGEMAQAEAVKNVSVHATINANVNGRVYAGGLFGISATEVDGAIVLGDINVTAERATVGGAVGENRGASVATNNTVSLMQIWVTTTSTALVNGIVGSETTKQPAGVYAFMKNAVWNNGTAVENGLTYSELFGGSVSGYINGSEYYYTGDTGNTKGTYDVLNDIKLTRMDGETESRTNPRESMRLADIVDIYVLMYSKTEPISVNVEGVKVEVFDKSEYSWLVGRAHGTDNAGDAIQIANQQGVALLRELRFATFELKNDVRMYSTYKLQTVSGAFYGSVIANGHSIYIPTWNGTQKMFEIELGTNTPTAVLKNN